MPKGKYFDINDVMSHFDFKISKELEQYAKEEVFKSSRYIFTWNEGKHKYGYCTYCKNVVVADGFSHNHKAICPNCHSQCTVKAGGLGRKSMVDEAYFVYYHKSSKDPNTIVASGIYAVRDYRGDYRHVETQFVTTALYVFRMGDTVSIRRYAYYSAERGYCYLGNWEKCSSVTSQFNRDHTAHIYTLYSRESIKNAVKDTPFQYSTWESYFHEDMVKFFDLYARYPCIEYLTKLGFSSLVQDKLEDQRTYGAIDWRGSTLFKVLRLNKSELNQIKDKKIKLSFLFLKILQISRKDGSNLTMEEIDKIEHANYFYTYKEFESLLKYSNLRKVANYINKQYENQELLNPRVKYKVFYDKHSVLNTWNDYISDCLTLEMDLTKDSVLFPKNIYRAHQNTINQVKVKSNEIFNKKIGERAEKLYTQYYFEYSGLVIRPAISANELIAEGSALKHCVGNYAERYAKGDTNILLIRRIHDLNKPYFTMEVKHNTVYQVRGLNNCPPDELVNQLVDAFKLEKLEMKSNKERIKVSIPA